MKDARITFRLDAEQKERLEAEAQSAHKSLASYIAEKLVGQSAAKGLPSGSQNGSQLHDDLVFMFVFLNKNASKLEPSSEEMDRIAQIFKRVKNHEP